MQDEIKTSGILYFAVCMCHCSISCILVVEQVCFSFVASGPDRSEGDSLFWSIHPSCFFKEEVYWYTAAIQLRAIKTSVTLGKQSLHCAELPTCQDLLCFQCPHYVYVTMSARHKNPAFCGQSCSRKTKPHCQLHMRTLWDPHVILMKGSAQMGYRFFFFSASFEEYQNLLFLFRGLSGIEMKTCSVGIAVEIRDTVCALFSLKHVVRISLSISKVSKNCLKWSNRAANSDLRVLSTCPNTEVWKRGKNLSFLCSHHPRDEWQQSFLFLQYLSSWPKAVKNVLKGSSQDK